MAFSHLIKTPSGCFGATVAKGIPANLAKMKQWTRKLTAFGRKVFSLNVTFKCDKNITEIPVKLTYLIMGLLK